MSLLGETLDAITPAGHETVVMPGRPVAIVSNLLFEYRPRAEDRREREPLKSLASDRSWTLVTF